jgi:hypothetical protein
MNKNRKNSGKTKIKELYSTEREMIGSTMRMWFLQLAKMIETGRRLIQEPRSPPRTF